MNRNFEEQKNKQNLQYKELDEIQRKIVLAENQNLLIAAGPGAGKTRVIVNRIDYLVKNKNISPGNIIVITFTKAAAANMKRRYMEYNNSGGTPFFGTFHGLFYKILRNHYKEIQIISSAEAYKLVKQVLLTYLEEVGEEKVKEVLNAISIFKTSEAQMEQFSPCIDKDIFIECFTLYERYKAEKRLMDFDDLQVNCKNLFLKNPLILERYRKTFKHILVDEFQDCDNLQIQILKLLNKENFIFAVGDEDQCIYGFRGSRPECMVSFDKHFAGSNKAFLSTNYRSAENIVKLSMEVIKNNKVRTEKKIKSNRTDSKEIKVMCSLSETMQGEEIANRILMMNNNDKSCYKEHAILYRTNVESRSMIDVFIRKKIPFKLLDKEYNFFEHFICKDILAYLRLSLDPSEKESFLKIINKPFRYISRINLDKIKRNPVKEDCFDGMKAMEDIPNFQIRTIQNLKKDIHSLNKMSLRSAIDFIVLDIGYHGYLAEYSSKYKMNVSELEEVLEEFKASVEGFTTIIQFLAHVEEVQEKIRNNEKEKDEDAVILSTIHGVKGMEFNNVYIINCNEDTMPHINSVDENLEEERRLFYVGITRTINNLWLCVCKNIRGKAKEPSRFIMEGNLKELLYVEIGYRVGEKVIHKSYGEGSILFVNEKEIDIEFHNGISRKFNTEILIENGLLIKI